MSSPERLAELLPLANGDPLPPKALWRALLAFLNRFEAPGLRLPRDAGMWDAYRDASDAELQAVARKVRTLFEAGFLFEGPRHMGTEGIGPDDILPPLAFPSMRYLPLRPPPGRSEHRRGRWTFMVDGAGSAIQCRSSQCGCSQRARSPFRAARRRKRSIGRTLQPVSASGRVVGRPQMVVRSEVRGRVKAKKETRAGPKLVALRKAAKQKRGRKEAMTTRNTAAHVARAASTSRAGCGGSAIRGRTASAMQNPQRAAKALPSDLLEKRNGRTRPQPAGHPTGRAADVQRCGAGCARRLPAKAKASPWMRNDVCINCTCCPTSADRRMAGITSADVTAFIAKRQARYRS